MMDHVKTRIIPDHLDFINSEDQKLCDWSYDATRELDFQSICMYIGIGFFWDDSTYYRSIRTLKPATTYKVSRGVVTGSSQNWSWSYQPEEVSLSQLAEELRAILKSYIIPIIEGKRVILPLSGGLDSRALAAAIAHHDKVFSYSYTFPYANDETLYGRRIADIKNWPFESYKVKSYFWDNIENIARRQRCFTDLFMTRQMSVIDEINNHGDLYLLGHDQFRFGRPIGKQVSETQLISILESKLLTPKTAELASLLWKHWGLRGTFNEYFYEKIEAALTGLNIEDSDFKLKALKCSYFVPRFTCSALNVFRPKPICLPYLCDDVNNFFTKVPQHFWDDRKLQIEMIKQIDPNFAKVPWQSFAPLNLYNYENYFKYYNLHHRVVKKLKSFVGPRLRSIQRNWELQMHGQENRKKMQEFVLNPCGELPLSIMKGTLDGFNNDPDNYNLLLTRLITVNAFLRLHHGQSFDRK